MSRVVESDQRLIHEKVFPRILKAFGITDYDIQLPQPEEKAENTRISFAQQKIAIANQFSQLGFDVQLKEQDVPFWEADFIVSGKPVPTAQMQAEQTALGIQQTRKAMEQEEQQMQMAQEQAATAQEEGPVDPEEGAEPIQAMQKAYKPPSQRKFKGRTGGVTPDWSDKHPDEERDIDAYTEAREKNQLTLSKTWIESLNEKGFASPLIKEVAPDMTQMWFSENNVDYIAQLSGNGITTIEKAVFGDPTRFSRVKQTGNRKPTEPTKINLDDE